MFDLGLDKVLVVLLLALVMFGPNELPQVARNIGSALRTVRGFQDEIRSQVHATLNGESELTLPDGAVATASGAATSDDDPARGASFI